MSKNKGSKGSSSGRPRSAITGHFVTQATANRHPKTTVVEKRK